MSTLFYLLAALSLFWLGSRLAIHVMTMRLQNSEAFQKDLEDYQARRQIEYDTDEVADWFGTTGLDEGLERELPRYLRREFGEFLDQPDALRAAQLRYLGRCIEGAERWHYWRLPNRDAEPLFAHVQVNSKGEECLGWGPKGPTNLS